MPEPGRIRRWLDTRGPYLIALAAIVARIVPTPRTIDDAFITFRYARNLLAGVGFVFNAGEHVLGTTTPLYTVLLATLAGLMRSENYPWLALLVNSLADGLTCLVLVRLGEHLTGRRAVGIAAALVWVIAPMSVTFAIGGMETSVFILVLTATMLFYVTGRSRQAAVSAALLLLTRPDGALLVAPLMLDVLIRAWRARRLPLAEAGLFLGVLLPWVIFATLYFGSPVPHSIAAKSLAYRLPAEAALVRLLQHYATPFFEHEVFGVFWPAVGLLLYPTLSLIGGLGAIRRNGRAWPLVVYPWVYFAVFAAANPLIFRWYLAPPLPFYFLLVLAGLDRVLCQIATTRAFGRLAHLGPRLLAAPTAAFLLLSLGAWVWVPDHGPRQPAPEMAWHLLELHYTDVGKELAVQVTPATTLAAGDVGALGYYTGARILDTVGLMSPEASAYYPAPAEIYAISYAIPAALILDHAPDYVVILETYGRKGLLPDERFQAEYMLVEKVETDIYDSDGLLVLRRRAP